MGSGEQGTLQLPKREWGGNMKRAKAKTNIQLVRLKTHPITSQQFSLITYFCGLQLFLKNI